MGCLSHAAQRLALPISAVRIGLIIYGTLDTLSGGYLYDRMLVRSIEAEGSRIDIISLPWRNYLHHLGDNLLSDLARRITAARYDLVLQDELNHPSLVWVNQTLRRTYSGRLISIVHHLRSDEDHPRVAKSVYRLVETAYLRSVDAFIFNSQTTRRQVEARLGRAVHSAVAYPAADHIEPPTRGQILDTIKQRVRAQGPLRILFVGNLIERKGLHYLLAALEALSPGSVHLDVVGSTDADPAYTVRVFARAAKLAQCNPVRFHGRVGDDALRRLYQSAHLFAVPSYEGFGIVYLEAMAHGLPVIASTAGAAHEIVEHDHNGYLVAPPDISNLARVIRHLAENRGQLEAMSLAARARFEVSGTWNENLASAHRLLREMHTRQRA